MELVVEFEQEQQLLELQVLVLQLPEREALGLLEQELVQGLVQELELQLEEELQLGVEQHQERLLQLQIVQH